MADFVAAERFSSFPSITGKIARESVENKRYFALYVAEGWLKFSRIFKIIYETKMMSVRM